MVDEEVVGWQKVPVTLARIIKHTPPPALGQRQRQRRRRWKKKKLPDDDPSENCVLAGSWRVQFGVCAPLHPHLIHEQQQPHVQQRQHTERMRNAGKTGPN